MNARSYRLRLRGLPESEGQLKVSTLRSVMDALQLVAERSTRLAAEGKSTGSGRRPSWLVASTDFTVVSLGRGSTILEIKAPCFSETAQDQICQMNLWSDSPRPEDTALDVAANAIEGVRSGRLTQFRVNTSVCQAILKLGESAGHSGVRFELEAQDETGKGFVLDRKLCQQVQSVIGTRHPPRAYVVSGQLDQITHDGGHFSLVFKTGESLRGQVDSEYMEIDSLRPHWGRPTTIRGLVSFWPDGRARSIKARHINAREEGDRFFEKFPRQSQLFDPDFLKREAEFDLSSIIGKWPGDESIEEILAMLD